MSDMYSLRWAIKIASEPATEPFSLAEVKEDLRLESSETAEDTFLTRLIKAVRVRTENYCSRQFINATWDLYMDEIPTEFRVPRPPLTAVTYIKYYDTDGVQQTMDSSIYTVDTISEPGAITVAYGKSWPSFREIRNTINVRYTCGYGATGSKIPADILQAMLKLIGDGYEFRERFSMVNVNITPDVAEMLAPYRIPEMDA